MALPHLILYISDSAVKRSMAANDDTSWQNHVGQSGGQACAMRVNQSRMRTTYHGQLRLLEHVQMRIVKVAIQSLVGSDMWSCEGSFLAGLTCLVVRNEWPMTAPATSLSRSRWASSLARYSMRRTFTTYA